jgi:hypothetical protein
MTDVTGRGFKPSIVFRRWQLLFEPSYLQTRGQKSFAAALGLVAPSGSSGELSG